MLNKILKFLRIPCKRYFLVSNYGDYSIGTTTKSELEHCLNVDDVHAVPYWANRTTWAPINKKKWAKYYPKNAIFSTDFQAVRK